MFHNSFGFWLRHTGSVNLRSVESPAAWLPLTTSPPLHRERGENKSLALTILSAGFLEANYGIIPKRSISIKSIVRFSGDNYNHNYSYVYSSSLCSPSISYLLLHNKLPQT